ncbi:unnamed protein product [Paramecium octaurelia]|uniref:Uncharacterized protein n=1 Tax=Paramecium octaurelia TaxID=43137 RepID=A0A8S1SXM4_PAROT|nr:unnamed protein product [Paramecium octaurelia]CAD8144835.1 unnamed protein product [Paramecium octaurelia]
MDADIFKEMFPQDYMKKFLEKNVRIDGRLFNQPRQISIEFAEGFTHYQYADCFISVKHIIREVELKEVDLNQCIKLSIIMDNQEDLSNIDKARIEKHYLNQIQDIVTQIVDPQRLKNQNSQVTSIELFIRVAGADGSLLSHLINCVSFSLQQIKQFQTKISIINKELKCSTFGMFQDKIFVDPSDFEERNSSVLTVISFLDDEQVIFKKYDGKPLNYNQIQQIIQSF